MHHFINAVDTQSFMWLTDQTLVDKVCALLRKTKRQVLGSKLNGFFNNCVPYFTTSSAAIGSLPKYEFERYYSNGKVVSCDSVVLFEKNLGSHVAWCSTVFFGILRRPLPRYSKVCKSEIASAVKNKVLRFQVSMNDSL